MKKRIAAWALVLILALTLFPTAAFAVDLPNGWWPVWSAYTAAAEAGNDDDILAKGDAVIRLYTASPRNLDIANGLFVVYSTRLDRLIYENKGDYDNALKNTNTLLELCQYLEANDPNGANFTDWIRRCKAHLEVLEPFTGVYAASYTQSNRYGSKIAAASGAYYGAVADSSRYYGDRSICSFYVELESQTAGQFDYLISPKADGQRVILVNLNFAKEGTTARAIPSGGYDAGLRETLEYLATLKSPVLLRVGGEMDVWTDAVTPSDFIAAYKHVAALARSLAPKVELVWSPNFTAAWGKSAADYYPGDSDVDWVGLSLYYNYAAASAAPTQQDLEYFHWREFADPIANAERVVKIARAHNKPVIATEGGATNANGESYQASKVAKEFSALTMVYPEVKAIVYFDRKENANDYTITGSVKTAVDSAIEHNPTLLEHGESSAATYIPIDKLNEKLSGTLTLGATGRTFRSSEMSAVWKLDNKQTSSANVYSIDLSALAAGRHKLEVTLSDGKGYTAPAKVYTLEYAKDGTVKVTAGYTGAAAPELYGNTPFTDVLAGAYYEDAVNWAAENAVTTGTGAATFSPASTVTRAQAVTFLWRAMGQPEPASANNPFTDVDSGKYSYAKKAILWAVEKGITNGVTPTTFGPGSDVTRGQMIVFLYRAMDEPGKTGAGQWYTDAEAWANGQSLLAGTAETYATGAKCPRADVVTYLYRALAR